MSIFLFHAMRSSYLYLSPCSSTLSGHPSSSFWGLLQAYVSFRTQQKRIMTWYTLLVRPTSGIKHVQLRCREWSEPVTDGGIFSGDFGDVLMCRKIREYPDSWPLATREINEKMHWVLIAVGTVVQRCIITTNDGHRQDKLDQERGSKTIGLPSLFVCVQTCLFPVPSYHCIVIITSMSTVLLSHRTSALYYRYTTLTLLQLLLLPLLRRC